MCTEVSLKRGTPVSFVLVVVVACRLGRVALRYGIGGLLTLLTHK